MKCQNSFCIYWSDNACSLHEISLDINGHCEACINVEVDENVLNASRKDLLFRLKRSETNEQ